MPEIIDEHGQRLAGKGLVKHLGRADRRAGIADQRMRHRAHAGLFAEEMRRRFGGAADEPDRPGDLLRVRRPDRGGIGHHLGHLGAGAVARVHR